MVATTQGTDDDEATCNFNPNEVANLLQHGQSDTVNWGIIVVTEWAEQDKLQE